MAQQSVQRGGNRHTFSHMMHGSLTSCELSHNVKYHGSQMTVNCVYVAGDYPLS